MINKWYITGDLHRQFNRVEKLAQILDFPFENAVIILGDAGINYYNNNIDIKNKKLLNSLGLCIYCVHGNHEMRPETIPTMQKCWDVNVHNWVYRELEYPNINYFIDGNIYSINGRKTLVLGGAYSVDKYYRLSMGYNWFADEQISEDKRIKILENFKDKEVDIILSHTCPLDWQPTDLFLSSVDQSTVDNSMEKWLNEIKDNVKYKLWLFGHYHADRLVRPHVEMIYTDTVDLDIAWNMWNEGGEVPPYYETQFNYNEKDNIYSMEA